MVHLVFLISY
jgi:hypothetical protein